MDEAVSWTKVFAAIVLCLSMVSGMLVILPDSVVAAPPDGYIQGNVNDGLNPLPGSVVVAMPTFGGLEIISWTDAMGDYLIAAPGGLDYYVLAYNDTCYGSSRYTRVNSGETVFLNFTLTTIAPAVTDVTLTGFVEDELGNPVVDAMIGAYSSDPANMGDGPPMYINMTRTDGTGQYVVNVLPTIAGGGIVALGIPGYPFTDNSTDEALVSGNTYWINLTLMPLSYDNDASVSGTVTDYDTGLPLENVLVMVESWNESSGEGSSNMTWTDSNGEYSLDIKSGSVRVVMSKTGYTMFMRDSIEVLPGENEVVNASLRASNALVRGNVTEGGTGLPINMARVFLFDTASGIMNIAFTNVTGAYTLEAFDGTGLVIGAEADGYSRQYMMVDIDPGDELWMDFELRQIDATVSGTVTDASSGLPVENAGIHYFSPEYEEWDDSDAAGNYGMELVSGNYTVEVYSSTHRFKTFNVTISPGPNVVDIQLLPWDLPERVRLHGYVNDSQTGAGIGSAFVEVGLGPPDYSERNSTWTDPSGYYEITIPEAEMIVVVYAWDHTHVDTVVDGTNETEIRADFLLDPDMWAPNMTYSQSPTDNVSWTNPTLMQGVAQELDARSLGLWQLMKSGSAGGWSYYYAIELLYANLHPLEQSANNLFYSKIGDTYTVVNSWSAQPMCGWLSDGVLDEYLPYYEYWMGPTLYNALRGEYRNSTLMPAQPGTAWFDGVSGEFLFFTFDNGMYGTATPDDPSGVVTAYSQSIQVEDGTGNWWWVGTVAIGDWSVVGLTFTPDWLAPSGDYASIFFVNDWSGRGAVNLTLYTVDNDPPVADAGPGQVAVVDTAVTLDGSMSSDNVGIDTYMWFIDDGGPVTLVGETLDYNFTTVGNHTVTLMVWDGAGHSDEDTTWVDVLGDEPPEADAGPDQDVAIDTVVHFDGTKSTDDVGIVNYTWTIVELMVNMWGPTPEYTFTIPGLYNVTLVVEDTKGQLSAPDTMQVNARDVSPPTADAGTDQTMMGGQPTFLDGSGSFDDVGIVNWTWTFEYMGSPVVLYGETVDFTFWVEGVYNITLNVTDAAGNWDTDVVQITIAGIIPEFPMLMLPVTGMLAAVLLVALRKRRLRS